jgi:hypothetical protein
MRKTVFQVNEKLLLFISEIGIIAISSENNRVKSPPIFQKTKL